VGKDTKLVVRDRFLIGVAVYMLVLAVVVRYGLPPSTRALIRSTGFDLSSYYPLIGSFLAVTATSLAGLLTGFLLLEEKEDRTVRALLVSPLSLRTYLGYRMASPMALGSLAVLVVVLIAGVAVPPLWPLVAIAIVASLFGVAMALFLPATAQDKITAFAIAKIVSAFSFIPVAAYFVRDPWQYLFGVYPPYWVFRAYWEADAVSGMWWVYLAAGVVTHTIAIAWLVRRLRTVMYR
jgi:fluoroquinolone transport system permease protein